MKKSDQYHKWVEWSEEDQIYIGKCPDVIAGIHSEDPVQLYGFLDTGRPNPEVEWPRTWERLGMLLEPNHAPKKVNLDT